MGTESEWMDPWVVWLPADAPPEREALTEGLALARQCLDHRPRPAHHRVAVVVPSTVVLVAMADDGVSIRHMLSDQVYMPRKICKMMKAHDRGGGGGWPAGRSVKSTSGGRFMVTPAGHPAGSCS